MKQLRLFLLIVILFANSFLSAAQSKSELADQAFSQGSYADAMLLYKDLLGRYAEDPTYNYRYGVSCFLSNIDLEEAYKYLKSSSTKDVPSKVYYYLGEVCRYLYRFDESLEYYKRFMVNGGSPDVTTVELEMAASATVNGQNMLKYGANIEPIAKAITQETEFYSIYDTYSADGGFAPLPENLRTTLDRKHGNNSVMYSKKNGGNAGDVSVFASYGGGETHSLDLYYMMKRENGTWTSPARLPSTINSPFDEAYPYMCSDNKTLYFASRGLFGVGGYDIYRTTFDTDSLVWSTPENLGYPINSPYDDFLFVPDTESGTACFASKRDATEKGEITVYKIGNYGNEIKLTLTSEEARLMQSLDPEAKKVSEKTIETIKKGSANSAYEGLEKIDDYRNLKRALQRADNIIDSTNKRLDRLRLAWGDMPDSMRTNIQKLIVYNEGQSAQYTELRTSLAQQINAMEQAYIQGTLRDSSSKTEAKEWFVEDIVFVSSITDNMKRKLLDSPMDMASAMSLLDTVANIEMEIRDLRQMQEVASSEDERIAESKQIDKLLQGHNAAIEQLFAKWPVFYKSYYEVMLELGRAVQSNMADRSLLDEAGKNSLAAQGIRSNTVATNDSEKRYRMVEEAFKAEQRSITQLNLYLAQEANRTELADSLSKVLSGERSEAMADVQAAKSATGNSFGAKQRESVEFSDRTVDAPEVEPEEFALNGSPVYSLEMPFPSTVVLPQGVAYSIQLGSFSQSFNYKMFKFSPMFYDNAGRNSDIKKLYAGIFTTYFHAQKSLKAVKENGFKDAFIVAFSNKKIVTMAQARQHEGKQTSKPETVQQVDENVMYRVVVGTFEGEMPTNIKEVVQKLLSNKELIKSIMPSGEVTYSIGNFDNFDEALPLKDKLISEGVIEAFVTKIDLNKTIKE